jgi:flagellar motor switch protein FliN/FliY
MNDNEQVKRDEEQAIEALLAGYQEQEQGARQEQAEAVSLPGGRDLSKLMRRIPVTLTLEVGEAKVSLHELANLRADSVVELNTLAGEPLLLKVNGAVIGRAEVVVTGENHGLKIVEMAGLDLDQLQP